jgi:hypothetical protein
MTWDDNVATGVRCRGHSFLKVNEELLDIYAACDTSQQVIAAQQAHLARMAAGQAQAAARKSALNFVFADQFFSASHIDALRSAKENTD